MNYYNDNEPYACEWLMNLERAGEIPQGYVDQRSIVDVQPDELKGYDQCHFFAGIGGWPLALRLAGWPDDAPVWTGSCPCQPFSQAGKRLAEDDPRHLWPEFLRLIEARRPEVVFGEQVVSTDGHRWIAGVYADLESIGYRVPRDENGNYEFYDLPAAGQAAPHPRQRYWWVADTAAARRERGRGAQKYIQRPRSQCTAIGGVGFAASKRLQQRSATSATAGHWRAFVPASRVSRSGEIQSCRIPDPESGIQPLAYGIPRKLGPPLTGMGQVGIRAARSNRVGRLRGYGNAIVPQLAAEFIRAYMGTESSQYPHP